MNIGIILSAIFVPVCVMAVFSAINKSTIAINKTMSDEQFIVMIPKIVFTIGLVLDLFCAAIIIGFTFFFHKSYRI
ncbi:MAG TPA: hypothetical protein GXX17_06025 [Clostridiales bacterium]|nr:hypothetical protein [Clostridiales bacterium]